MKKNVSARYVVTAAFIAAAYAGLTYLSSAFGLAYSGLQFRLSEALNVLAAFTPAAIPGLTIGCLLGNLNSPFGLLDIALGTLATLLSAIIIRIIAKHIKKGTVFLIILQPAIINAVTVGLETAMFSAKDGSLIAFTVTAIQVFIGEITVGAVIGIPLYKIITKRQKLFF